MDIYIGLYIYIISLVYAKICHPKLVYINGMLPFCINRGIPVTISIAIMSLSNLKYCLVSFSFKNSLSLG